MPGNRAALYTLKPTIGIVSQQGIVPVSHICDAAGPMTKSVLDLANLMDIIVDPAKTNIPESGFASAITNTWADLRVGVLDPAEWNYPDFVVKPYEGATKQMVGYAILFASQADHCVEGRLRPCLYKDQEHGKIVSQVRPPTKRRRSGVRGSR